MQKRVWAMFLVLAVVGCGRGEPLRTQESQRLAFEPELHGSWTSACANKTVDSVTFVNGTLTFQSSTFADPECETRLRTVAHAGTYSLAVNYKTGVENSIIFQAGPDVSVTLHTDDDVDAQTTVLNRINNNEKEADIPPGLGLVQRKAIVRENMRIRAAKALTVWKKDEPKSLNRLQFEKLKSSLGVEATAEQGSRKVYRYEVDNGYLQLGGKVYFQPPGK